MNTKYNIVILFTCVIACLTLSCENLLGGTQSLHVENKTNNRIYYWYSRNYTVYHYPDTLLPTTIPVQIGEVAPNNSSGTGGTNPNWDKLFAELPEGLFSVYFFDSKPANQQEWDSLRLHPERFSRKDVTQEELRVNDYVIPFP